MLNAISRSGEQPAMRRGAFGALPTGEGAA